jgi:two-component system chemotaxis response regulator CheY
MRRIVIADDSQTSRMIIRRCLEIIGFKDVEFHEAADGAEALTMLKNLGDVDLLVTDLNMPKMGGELLLKAVKEDAALAAMPVLVITSAGNPAKEAELVDNGAFGICNKPISPSILFQKLKIFIQK